MNFLALLLRLRYCLDIVAHIDVINIHLIILMYGCRTIYSFFSSINKSLLAANGLFYTRVHCGYFNFDQTDLPSHIRYCVKIILQVVKSVILKHSHYNNCFLFALCGLNGYSLWKFLYQMVDSLGLLQGILFFSLLIDRFQISL